jgi:hypothetical protein
VKILVASRDIQEGEEITFSYQSSKNTDERKVILLVNYGFVCHCAACTTSPEIEAMLMRSKELDEAILQCGSRGQIDLAIRKGKALLQIYDKLNESSWLYQRTYYDMFQVAITKRKYLKDGLEYIRKSHEAALAFTSDSENESVRKMKSFVDSPSSHRNYLSLS